MNKELQGQGQALQGTEPYGTRDGTVRVGSGLMGYHGTGVELAPPSGVEYKTPTPHCSALSSKEEECLAPRAKGTLFCIGHLRQIEKKAAAQQASDAALDPKE
jgi:hypothetical protein